MPNTTLARSRAREAVDGLVNIVKWAIPGYIPFRMGEMMGADEARGQSYSPGLKAFYYTAGVFMEAAKLVVEYRVLDFLGDKLFK